MWNERNRHLAATSACWACFVISTVLAGCSSGPTQLGQSTCDDSGIRTAVSASQFERGRPSPLLDGVGWVVGVPAKIVMFDHRVDNHKVSENTERAIEQYLVQNDLNDVKVRVNQYDPLGEWKRLRENQHLGWPVRYTFGAASIVGYSLFPGRVFGGDYFNPYTNSVYLYSDIPAMAVYEGAFAENFATQNNRNLYAVGYALPGVGLWYGAEAAGKAIDHLQSCGSASELKDGYRSIYPAYARNVAPLAAITDVPLTLPAIAVGHVVGQVKAAGVKEPSAANE